MHSELEQTRYIVEYGAQLVGVTQESIDRITSRSHLGWICATQKEFSLFESTVQKWVDEFKGSESEKKHFQAFVENVKDTFYESIFQSLEEIAMIRFAEENEFTTQLRLVKEEFARRKALGIEDEPEDSPGNVQPPVFKPEITHHTRDDVTSYILAQHPEFPDWLVKQCGEIGEVVLVELSNKKEVEDILKLLKKQINKLRTKLWDYVRPLRPQACDDALLSWVRLTTANAANYCVVVLTGASKNVLDAEQSKLYDSGIRLIHQNYVSEALNMNTPSDTQPITIEDNATAQACPENITTSQSEGNIEMITETVTNTTIEATATVSANESTLEKKDNLFRRAVNCTKNKTNAAVKFVRETNWLEAAIAFGNSVGDFVFLLVSELVIFFLAAVFIRMLIVPVAVILVSTGVFYFLFSMFHKVPSFLKTKARNIADSFKGFFNKSPDASEVVVEVNLEPVTA